MRITGLRKHYPTKQKPKVPLIFTSLILLIANYVSLFQHIMHEKRIIITSTIALPKRMCVKHMFSIKEKYIWQIEEEYFQQEDEQQLQILCQYYNCANI